LNTFNGRVTLLERVHIGVDARSRLWSNAHVSDGGRVCGTDRVELPSGRRPKAVVWTDARVAHWQATGERPRVAVWTPLQTFRRLAEEAGLPPIRLHDLRHGAASLSLAAGNDLKTVQDLLGHDSIVLTADTYRRDAVSGPPCRRGHRESGFAG
jgi:hypothetical protein